MQRLLLRSTRENWKYTIPKEERMSIKMKYAYRFDSARAYKLQEE
jgi:hypothetical protein